MIYFIQEAHNPRGCIKIGTTTDMPSRLDDLQRKNRREIHVLGVLAGSYEEEAWLHHQFQTLHVRYEWYRPGSELLGYIAMFARAWGGWKDFSPNQDLSQEERRWQERRDQKARIMTARRMYEERMKLSPVWELIGMLGEDLKVQSGIPEM